MRDLAGAKDYRCRSGGDCEADSSPTSWICKSRSRRIETEQKRLRENSGQVHHVAWRMGQSRSCARRALHRQHQARPDLVAGYEDQLQLQLGRPVRPLHCLPSLDRQDGKRLGDRAGVSGDSALPSAIGWCNWARRPTAPQRRFGATDPHDALSAVYGIILRRSRTGRSECRDGSGRGAEQSGGRRRIANGRHSASKRTAARLRRTTTRIITCWRSPNGASRSR